MDTQTRHIPSNFLPCWFLFSGEPIACLFNSLLIPGDQTKKFGDVMAA